MKKLRRQQAKTDYKARETMLHGEKPRIVFRKTNKYIIGQEIKSKEAKDFVVLGVISNELANYGWPKTASGSLKSIPAAYLTGFLLGKKMIDKDEKAEVIFDLGLIRNVKGSRAYAFLKGVVDSGVEINADKKVFPDESRILGRHMKSAVELGKIKSAIEKKFE